MASQRASITKELLHESLESVLKPFKIHSLDDGKFSCVLEFLMGRKSICINQPTGSGTQLVVSNIRLFSRVHSPRARCEESVLSGYTGSSCLQFRKFWKSCLQAVLFYRFWWKWATILFCKNFAHCTKSSVVCNRTKLNQSSSSRLKSCRNMACTFIRLNG